MACNDLSLASDALASWKKSQPNLRKHRQSGACMYFVRIQLAHLYEALDVVRAIREDSTLLSLVAQCDSQTQASFQELQDFLRGGLRHGEFKRLVGQIRHNLAFHYNDSGKLIEKAIEDRAARSEAQVSSITRGDTAHLWHFKVADDVLDSIIVRQIWEIPRTSDLRTEADKVAGDVHRIFLQFLDFAGEFIWKYCENWK